MVYFDYQPPPRLRVSQVAKWLQVSKDRVYRWQKQKLITRIVYPGEREGWYDREEIKEFIRSTLMNGRNGQ
jgi:predicted DNA-binding transcriptional regulator AlpA